MACVACIGCEPAAARTFPPADPELFEENEANGDPFAGRFPLAVALEGLALEGELRAELRTSEGVLHCRLSPETAPLTVANFVGLARGLRPYRDEQGEWVKSPFFDGLPFHRTVPGQFVQTGRRGRDKWPGFRIQDEVAVGDAFTRPGVMAMANDGSPNSGAAQFFITTGEVRSLDEKHTIFGRCDEEWIVRQIESKGEAGQPAILEHVEITRG